MYIARFMTPRTKDQVDLKPHKLLHILMDFLKFLPQIFHSIYCFFSLLRSKNLSHFMLVSNNQICPK